MLLVDLSIAEARATADANGGSARHDRRYAPVVHRRRIFLVLGIVAVCALVAFASVRHLERIRVVREGNVVIAIEGHDLTWWNDFSIGVGIIGTLGLVGDRCVGFVSSEGSGGTVIVWPAGTEIVGEGPTMTIRSEGKTVRIGQQVVAGSAFGHDFAGIRKELPRECRTARLVQVGLNS